VTDTISIAALAAWKKLSSSVWYYAYTSARRAVISDIDIAERRKVMGLHENWGRWLFFLVPIILWLIGGGVAMFKGRKSPFLAYIAGSDNRLSLSRLQAFLWTLVIFGAFAAAMAVHTPIVPGTREEAASALEAKKGADDAWDKANKDAPDKAAQMKIAARTLEENQKAATEKAEAAAKATESQKPAAEKAAKEANDDAQKAMAAKADADMKAAEAKARAAAALSEKKAADLKASSYTWVIIPDALLALAGIAIGSGIFSSFIAAKNGEEKTASIIGIGSAADLPNAASRPSKPANTSPLVITGQNLGKTGRVRLDSDVANIFEWKEDGTRIVVDVPDNEEYKTLVVETSNGKLSYELEGKSPNLILGEAKINYEFIDLFRDDKNPDTLDTMKFQMFGWTIIAIFIYVWLFLSDLTPTLLELPTVPQSIVILTGLSQGGYLAGKAVSNANK
jgi:hypothetical protein